MKQRRTAKNYDGTNVTTHRMSELLLQQLSSLADKQGDRPDLILMAWPEIIGSQLLPMTEVLSFQDGVLYVKVKNSTLHSLLSVHEKPRIMNNLKAKFPKVYFRNIVFRIG
jgi:hypothetical protein